MVTQSLVKYLDYLGGRRWGGGFSAIVPTVLHKIREKRVKNVCIPIMRRETVRWSLPAGLMAPRAVPTSTQHTATRAISAINHLNDPGFQDNRPQQLFGGSSENRPLKKTIKTIREMLAVRELNEPHRALKFWLSGSFFCFTDQWTAN